MKKLLQVFAVLLALLSGPAQAQYVSGSEYMQWADANDRMAAGRPMDTDAWNASRLNAYTLGVADSFSNTFLCISNNVVAGQLVAIAVKYIRSRPEQWNQPASFLILAALSDAFPCKK